MSSQKNAASKSAEPPANPPANPPAPPPADDESTPAKRGPSKAEQLGLSPLKPDGYKPVGKVRVLAEAKRDGVTVRVVSDDRRVWKEVA